MSRHVSVPMVLVLLAIATSLAAFAQVDRFYGEPVELKSNFMYFTSWKYVRQGSFAWKLESDPGAAEADKANAQWLAGDSARPARFETIDMPRGFRLVAQPAEKVPFKPGQIAAQVFDDGKYKTWYTVGPTPEPEPNSSKDKILPGYNSYIAYAESADAVTWTIPKLGLIEYAGNKDNNIVFRNDLNGSVRGFHGGSVFIDPSSKEEHYKMFYLGIVTDDEWNAFAAKYPNEVDTMARRKDVGGFRCVVAVFGAVSPDGLHWTSLPEPLMIQHADTQNTCDYDADRKQYVAYVRAWQVNAKAPGFETKEPDNWIGVGRRSIGRSVSKDFRHFSKPEIIMSTAADEAPSHLYYTNGKTTLPGAPDNHVMFPWVWELESDGGSVRLLSSADGVFWSRVPGPPVVDMGAPGAPDGGYVTVSGNLLEYPGDRWGITYGGNPIPHKYPGRDPAKRKGLFPGVQGVGGIATWPKGRLVALQCDEEGEFATVAVIPKGEHIRLNASVKPTGYIKTAVRAIGRGDIPGRGFDEADRLVGDGLAMPVTWKGETTLNNEGAPVALRFQLRQAKLFAVEFY
ncbi:MAG: hypothetical protein HZB26_05870 [Candidatus Hydrogenedentes bacterium]|nr:hypothetical protein [Candidatus Hydrogenedentota bacterium]